ncbi:hypothetical protein C8F01DRAFT_641424 [Mycena amicta]|nr:hypothetical protein C8F01DRAFT_641424 [Mycena amicta]
MQLSLSLLATILATMATTAIAGPAPIFLRDPAARAACDISSCVLAIGPGVVGCGSAVAQAGADPFSDAACLLAAAKDIKDFPASCSGCADEFGVTDAISKAASSVKSGISSLGDDISGLF